MCFGFCIFPMNNHPPFNTGDLSIGFKLISGDGFGGSILKAISLTPVAGFEGYFDVDFASVILKVDSYFGSTRVRLQLPRHPDRCQYGARALLTGDLRTDASRSCHETSAWRLKRCFGSA